MMDAAVTRHGLARLSQRGIRLSDIDILLSCGSETGTDRIMLRKRDAAAAIGHLQRQISKLKRLTGTADPAVRKLKRLIASLERLAGKEIVVADGRLVTAYHRTRPLRPPGGRKTRKRRKRLWC